MNFSKSFVRFNWLALVFIYLVVIAGSFVRITGSGMGCPDWPKCFGQWVPPTEEAQLPDDYKEIYLEKRLKKLDKFTRFLRGIGMEETAQRIEEDPTVLQEEDFNGRKTWTEYVNRLCGFLAGNALLIAFIWMLLRYRKRRLIVVASINLVLMAVQGWFGSIVVASNLVPWTITVHMLLALVIIGLQLYIMRLISPSQQKEISLKRWTFYLVWICFAITFYQMFLGTQVREAIDELTKMGYSREDWTNELGATFYIHRSFSWLVLVLLTIVAWKNEKGEKHKSLRWVYIVLALELLSGVLLAHLDMPGLVQTSHLIFATIIFGILTMIVLRGKSRTPASA